MGTCFLIKQNDGVQLGDTIAKTDIFSTLFFVVCYTIILSCIGSFWRVILTNADSGIDRLLTGILCLSLWGAGAIVVHVFVYSNQSPSGMTVVISAVLGLLLTLVLLVPFLVVLGGTIVSFWSMLVINPYFVVIPSVMIMLALISIINNGKKGMYTQKEQQLLAEKKALDAKNDQENAKKEAITLFEVGTSKGKAYQAIENRRKNCEKQIAELQKKVANNGWLYGDDIQRVDRVIYHMQSRRADSIKEALHLIDMELAQEAQRKLAEQRHKEMMEEIEYQSLEMTRMREEQREAAERAEQALRDSEAAAERARYDAEMRAYEEAWKRDQHRQNVEWELRKARDDG